MKVERVKESFEQWGTFGRLTGGLQGSDLSFVRTLSSFLFH